MCVLGLKRLQDMTKMSQGAKVASLQNIVICSCLHLENFAISDQTYLDKGALASGAQLMKAASLQGQFEQESQRCWS